jgi:sugar phosphate permease
MVGLPGLLLALPLWLLRDPRSTKVVGTSAPRPDYRQLLQNRSFMVNTLAMAAMTFALGGLAQWLPSFFVRVHGLDVAKANLFFGGVTVVAGIIGTAAGGWLGDRLQQKSRRGYLLVSGWGFVIGVPLAAAAILAPTLPLALFAVFLAECAIFLNTGPLNAVIVEVTPAAVRSMAFAVNIFFIHALGDAISPAVIGALSDRFGLARALLLAPAALLVAALFCFLCLSSIDRDTVQEEP